MIITTAIYYTNGKLHIGHAMELIGSDILVRYYKLSHNQVHFTTGLDEHVSKVVQAAKISGKTPIAYCDEISEDIKKQMESFGIDYSDFIRTTEERHLKAVREFWKRVEKNGYIYKKKYEGWYCEKSDNYFLEKDLGPNKESPESGLPCVWKEEENYFFKASAFEEKIKKLLQSNLLVPSFRSKEMLEFIKDGLKDFSVTRKGLEFAIPVPGDEEHKIYVWFDALINYLTVCGFPEPGFEKKWPVDLHVIGKDINRFHSIWWPAMLMAAGIEVPKKILVHGFINQNDQKMGKSKGNAVNPEYLVQNYGRDAFRYFLSSASFHGDISWDEQALLERFNAEVVNDFSNFFSRCFSMLQKDGVTEIPKKDFQFPEIDFDPFQLNLKMVETFRSLNKKFGDGEPWKLSKEDRIKFLLPLASEAIAAFNLVRPVLIDGAKVFDEMIVLSSGKYLLKEVPKLYRRLEIMKAPEPVVSVKATEQNYIEFDDFLKLKIHVGEIKEAVRVEGSDKLLKLMVDVGEEKLRQVVAGIGKYYEPEKLIGAKVNVLTNLAPRKIFGIESQGMILAASNKKELSVTGPLQSEKIKAGDKIS